MKKACIVVIISILAVVVIAFGIFKMNSFSFAIRRAGLNPKLSSSSFYQAKFRIMWL